MAVTPTVRISIDEIAVSGLPSRQVPAFAAGLEQALTDAFRAHGIPPSLAQSAGEASRPVAPIAIDRDRPADAGRAVGLAIYQGLAR